MKKLINIKQLIVIAVLVTIGLIACFQQKASAKINNNCPGPQAGPFMHATNHASNGGSSHSHYAGYERYDMPDAIKNCAEGLLRGPGSVVNSYWGGEYSETPTHHLLNIYGAITVDKDLASPGKITDSSFTYIDSYMVNPPSFEPIPGTNGIVSIGNATTTLGTIDKDQSKVSRQAAQIDKSRMQTGNNWICIEGKVDYRFDGKKFSISESGWCVERIIKPVKPVVSQFCSVTQVMAGISWPVGGSDVVRYSVQISKDNFAPGGGYWYRAPIPLGENSIADAPAKFEPIEGAVGPLTLEAGKTYYIRIVYDRLPGDWSNYYFGETEITIARSDCDPVPVPPAPTVTPTCTASKPTFDISWNSVAGLSPSSFTVDLDDNNFVGGTGWLYKDVLIVGPSPYSANSAPNSFLSYGAGPSVPLTPGTAYQFRVNYRGAGLGGADVYSLPDTKTARSDCAPPVPVPLIPTVTPTCTASKPTFDISWNSVAGLSPSSFTVDLDDNNFVGGTGWLYKDVLIVGPSPYSANSAPNSFLSYGAGPSVPLTPGTAYQFRVNYRGAGLGGADVYSLPDTKTARTDCVPLPSISCVSVNPSLVEASPDAYDVQIGYQNASGSVALSGATVTTRVATAPMQSTTTAVSPDLPGDGSLRQAPLTGIKTPIPGEYDVSLVFNGGNTPGGTFTISCSQKLAAYNGPYFRVFGGDVMAGGDSACSKWTPTASSTGSILAFSKSDGSPVKRGKGSGSQLLTQALSVIDEFSSAQHRTADPIPDKGLSLANIGVSQFGGAIGLGSCPPDYFANKSAAAVASNPLASSPAAQVSGPYLVSGPNITTLPSHVIGRGKSIVLYVSGNAYITGNIVYQAGTWTSVNDIPSFTLVAKGNIYIKENVTRLSWHLHCPARHQYAWRWRHNIYMCNLPTHIANAN